MSTSNSEILFLINKSINKPNTIIDLKFKEIGNKQKKRELMGKGISSDAFWNNKRGSKSNLSGVNNKAKEANGNSFEQTGTMN